MNKSLILPLLFGFVLLVLAACATEPESVVIRETVIAEVPATVEVTRLVEVTREMLVEVTREVEVTRLLEVTVAPTPQPTNTPLPQGDSIFALNYVTRAESGGVEVEVGRVLVANKSELPSSFSWMDEGIFEAVDVVAELLLVITNTTGTTLAIYPNQGTIQINTEQIDIFDWTFGADSELGDDLGGDIHPGVVKVGGFWFGIARSVPADINSMIFRFSAPYRPGSGTVGRDFEIVIDLSNHTFEPLPDELTR